MPRFKYSVLKGSGSIVRVRTRPLPQYTNERFNRVLFNGPTLPGNVPFIFDNNPDLLKTNLPDFLSSHITETWSQHQEIFKDYNHLDAKRSVYAWGETNDDGHIVFSTSFQPNPLGKLYVKDGRLFIHDTVCFAGGGGILSPASFLVDMMVNGRKFKRFPFDKYNELYPELQKYTAEVFRNKESLEGKVGILGSNAIYFSNHVIVTDVANGGSYQIARPQTIVPHALDGQGLWIASHHPLMPPDVVAYSFIGHGKHAAKLGDYVNTNFAPSLWQTAFRIGNISGYNFEELRKQIGEGADMLAADPQYQQELMKLLYKEDFAFRYNLRLLAGLDTLGGIVLRSCREMFGPNTCPVKPIEFESFRAGKLAVAGDECDTQEIDIDKLADDIESGKITDGEGIDKVFDEAPIIHIPAGMYTKDGKPYPGTLSSFTMYSPDSVSTFELPTSNLLGEPFDSIVADAIRDNLRDIPWDSTKDQVETAIRDAINQVVEAFDPFKDGDSVQALSSQYASTPAFADSIHELLAKFLQESLGARLNEIQQLLADNPATKDFPLNEYPAIESLAANIWKDMTSKPGGADSYFELRVKTELATQKINYISQPENKSAIQTQIADRLSKLGDLSTLSKDLSKTAGELNESQSALQHVVDQLIKDPGNADLKSQKEKLEGELQRQIDRLNELEEKQRQADELAREQNNLDGENLDHESKDAEKKADEKGKKIFEK
jgi:hypothetical protein